MKTSKELGSRKSEVDILLFAGLPTLIFPNDILKFFLKNILLQNILFYYTIYHIPRDILGTDVSENVA